MVNAGHHYTCSLTIPIKWYENIRPTIYHLFLLSCVWLFYLHVYLCTKYPQRLEEGVGSLDTGVKDGSELSCG